MDAIRPGRKGRYATAYEGCKAPQKMSVSDVVYNVMCEKFQ